MNILAFDLVESISHITSSLMGKIGDLFLSFFFEIFVRPLFKLMDTFIDIMLMLAGINPLDSASSDSNLITTFLQSGSISNLYMYIAIFSAVLLMMLAIVQVIKQDFFNEDGGGKSSHAKVIRKVVTGMIYIIAIPPIFLFAVSLVSQVFELLWNIDGINQLSALSQTIFELCLSKPEWMIRAELLNETTIELAPVPHWSVITTEQLTTLVTIYDFNFIIFLGVLGIAFYSMFMLAFGFAKRIFELVLLYVMGPIAIAQSVTDDGKFKQWKKDVVEKLISIFGTLISLVIFVIFSTEVNRITFLKDQMSDTNTSTIALFNMVVKALFMLVGFSVIRNGSKVIGNIVGGDLSIGSGASAFGDVKNAVSAATAPYKTVAKYGKAGVGAIKGTANAGFNMAAGIAKTGRAIKKNGIGGLFTPLGEKTKEKWHNATRLAGEDDYQTAKKKEREREEKIESIARNAFPPGTTVSSADIERVRQAIEVGLKSNNRTQITDSMNHVTDSMAKSGMSGAVVDGIGSTELKDSMLNILGINSTATTVDQLVEEMQTRFRTMTGSDFNTSSSRVEVEIKKIEAELQKEIDKGSAANPATISKLQGVVTNLNAVKTAINQTKKVKVAGEALVHELGQPIPDREKVKSLKKNYTESVIGESVKKEAQ